MKKDTASRRNIKVSVIICAYTMERLKDIHEAVDSVLTQTLEPYEVIVAIDHNEELYGMLRSELSGNVKLVLNEGDDGLSETRNVGIRATTGEIIAFIDDDATAMGTWLENLIPPFEDPAVMAVGGQTLPLWLDGKNPGWFPEELNWVVGCTYQGLPLNGNNVRNVPGGNMALRKGVFNTIGFFRTEVGRRGKTRGVGEEADICLRIKQYIPGAHILYEHKAVVNHKIPAWRLSLRYLAQRSYNEGFYKCLVAKLAPGSSWKALSTENAYLRHLLFTSIPQRIRRFYRPWSLAQAGAIIISIAATGVGYVWGKRRTNTVSR